MTPRRRPCPRLLALIAALVLSVASPPLGATPWSAADPRIAADVRAGRPLVIAVMVPLCDNAQIDCGGTAAGRPGDLARNLYWGAIFGQRRFFERKGSGWARVDRSPGEGALLERAIYRRRVPRGPWGGDGEVEQLVVLQAVHGGAIDEAVSRFWALATQGGEVRFDDAGAARRARIHVAGYAGHNRLMDGVALPSAGAPAPGGAPIPSFVMACASDAYFSAPLRGAGSAPLVMTRALMAPEGYVIDAIARGLGENLPAAAVRARAVEAYATWQRLSPGVASSIFAPAR